MKYLENIAKELAYHIIEQDSDKAGAPERLQEIIFNKLKELDISERWDWLIDEGFILNENNDWKHNDEEIYIADKEVQKMTCTQWNEFTVMHERYFDNI